MDDGGGYDDDAGGDDDERDETAGVGDDGVADDAGVV